MIKEGYVEISTNWREHLLRVVNIFVEQIYFEPTYGIIFSGKILIQQTWGQGFNPQPVLIFFTNSFSVCQVASASA